MYLQHFGMRTMPFSLAPSTAFLFASRSHQEGLNTLLVALRAGEGFVKITGEVGTGKTLLCRRLLNHLSSEGIRTAYIPNPLLQPKTLLLALSDELSLGLSPLADDYALMKALSSALFEIAAKGEQVVLCLDEAQALPDETLEAVRLLSNLETETRKLIQVVLFGQPELDEKLARHHLRPLRQRIAYGYSLNGLSLRETDRYLAHRVVAAGYVGTELFAPGAVRVLHKASHGVPRLINILAQKALLSVFGEGGHVVQARHIRAAIDDTAQTQAWPASRRSGWLNALFRFASGSRA